MCDLRNVLLSSRRTTFQRDCLSLRTAFSQALLALKLLRRQECFQRRKFPWIRSSVYLQQPLPLCLRTIMPIRLRACGQRLAVVRPKAEANLESRLMFSCSARWILPALLSVNMCVEGPVPVRDRPSSLCEKRIPGKRAVKLCVNVRITSRERALFFSFFFQIGIG